MAPEVGAFQYPAVAAVHYPGLESHPDHARGRQWFSGFGGVLSIDLAGGAAAAERLMGAFRLATAAPSLGGVEDTDDLIADFEQALQVVESAVSVAV